MKRIIFALAALLAFASPALAQGTPGSATVVSACGTPPSTYTAGQNRPVLQNTNGLTCSSSTATVSGTVTANQGTSNAGGANAWPVLPSNTIGITPTDATITSATGSSQTVMALNASRHSLIIQNTGNANCGVNPTGGTAAIGGAGTLTLFPGGSYQPRVPTLSAVTAICTSGQPLYAEQN